MVFRGELDWTVLLRSSLQTSTNLAGHLRCEMTNMEGNLCSLTCVGSLRYVLAWVVLGNTTLTDACACKTLQL